MAASSGPSREGGARLLGIAAGVLVAILLGNIMSGWQGIAVTVVAAIGAAYGVYLPARGHAQTRRSPGSR